MNAETSDSVGVLPENRLSQHPCPADKEKMNRRNIFVRVRHFFVESAVIKARLRDCPKKVIQGYTVLLCRHIVSGIKAGSVRFHGYRKHCYLLSVIPAMNCRAIFRSPYGTKLKITVQVFSGVLK